jgi:transposase
MVLIQPQKRDRRKTDRRDARNLRELLWTNRQRILGQKRPAGLRRVRICSPQEAEDRQITTLHKHLKQCRTRTINKVHHILLKHNLQHGCPTKGIRTLRARKWLRELTLPAIDQLEMQLLLEQWELYDRQLNQVDQQIRRRQAENPIAQTIATIPGISAFGSLAISSRIGAVADFPTGASLANFVGLTPGCRNSGATERAGSITKQGSSMIRYVLGQAVMHALRRDAWLRQWYQRIKRRRGTSIARVAVMRHLMTVIHALLKHDLPYIPGGPEAFREVLARHKALQGSPPQRSSAA